MSQGTALRQLQAAPRSATVYRIVPRPAAPKRPEESCSECTLRSVCLPGAIGDDELDTFDTLVATRRKVARGGALYRAGDEFQSLYAVHSGGFKTVASSRHGDEKITGFYLPGELLGLDSINSARHGYDAVALEDSEVCVLPFARLESASLRIPALQRQLLRVLSSDISRDQGLMLMLGNMTAEQRLAAFLLALSRRYERMGYDPVRFVLRMTRQEIGNYLGLTLETVSRLFSRFHREGLIAVEQREVELKDCEALREIVGH